MIGFIFRFYRQIRLVTVQQRLQASLLVVALFSYSTTGLMYFEGVVNPNLTWSSCAWWSIVTMTTVGYGDIAPQTMGGRLLVGVPTMLVGIGILGYLISILSELIMKTKLEAVKGLAQIGEDEHVVIIRYNGLDDMHELVTEIRKDRATAHALIVLVDQNLEELPSSLAARGVSFVRGKPARGDALNRANVTNARYVLIQADTREPEHSDNENLAIALTIDTLCRPGHVHTVVECLEQENQVLFERANVDGVICLDALSNQLMVQELQDPGLNVVLKQLTTNAQGKQFYIIRCPQNVATFGEAVSQVANDKLLVVGLAKGAPGDLCSTRDDAYRLLPDHSELLEDGDRLVVIAGERPALA